MKRVVVAALVFFFASPVSADVEVDMFPFAPAVGYPEDSVMNWCTTVSGVTLSAGSVPDACAVAWNASDIGQCNFGGSIGNGSHAAPQVPSMGVIPACSWVRVQQSGPRGTLFQVRYAQYLDGRNLPGATGVAAVWVPWGDCWYVHSGDVPTGPYGTVVPAACEPCPDGETWNAGSYQCEVPECEPGETWDASVSVCRAECTGTDFYHYSSGQCRAQCPVGLTYKNLVISNKAIPQSTLVVPTVNGCRVDYHKWCVEDMREPASGEGYFHGADYTGQVCMNWWTYVETIPIDIVSQEDWEEATGGSGYYDGDSTVEADVLGSDLGAVAMNVETPMEDAGDVTAVHVLCSGGVKRIAITVNGVLDESIFLGPCSEVDGPYTPGGLAQDEATAQLQTAVAEVLEKQDEQRDVLDAIEALAEEVKGMARSMAVSMGVAEPEEGEGEGGGIFTGPGADDDPYTSPYEDGLAGVIQDAQDNLDVTSFDEWRDGLIPTLPSDVPACLTFTLEVPFYDRSYPITPDCRVWDWLRIIFIASTLAGCYGVVLGRT